MKLQSNMMMFTRAAGIVYGLWFFLAPSSYFSLMLVPSEMVNELGIGQTQQIGLALFGIVWWIYRTAPFITSDNCSEFMMTHAGGWGIFAAGGLFLTITSGVPVAENPFFYQSVAFFYRFSIYAKAYTFGSWCQLPDLIEALNGSLLQRQWAIFIYHLFHPLLQHIERIT